MSDRRISAIKFASANERRCLVNHISLLPCSDIQRWRRGLRKISRITLARARYRSELLMTTPRGWGDNNCLRPSSVAGERFKNEVMICQCPGIAIPGWIRDWVIAQGKHKDDGVFVVPKNSLSNRRSSESRRWKWNIDLNFPPPPCPKRKCKRTY